MTLNEAPARRGACRQKRLGLSEPSPSEDVYRRALLKIGGVTSAKELDQEGFSALMGYFGG